MLKDEELFESYRLGDEAAFAVLYNRYARKLFSFLRVRLGAKKLHLLEELFQKTWLKVHLARQSFDSNRRFSSWFYTIALNTFRDELGSSSESVMHQELMPNLTDQAQSAEEQQIQKSMIARMHGYLSDLPTEQRTALLLSDEENLSSQEIAEAMRISDANARQLISRARRSIRQKFLKEEEDQ